MSAVKGVIKPFNAGSWSGRQSLRRLGHLRTPLEQPVPPESLASIRVLGPFGRVQAGGLAGPETSTDI